MVVLNARKDLASKATHCYDHDSFTPILEKIKDKRLSEFEVIFYHSLLNTDIRKEWFDKIYFLDNPTMKASNLVPSAVTFQNKIFAVIMLEKRIPGSTPQEDELAEYSFLCRLMPIKFTTFMFINTPDTERLIQLAVPSFCSLVIYEMQKQINKGGDHEVLINEDQVNAEEENAFEERNGDYICDHCLATGDNIVVHDNLIECYVCGNIKDLD